MGENNETETAEQQLLIERIEVASEIVRSSQATVAFQRSFYLEILTFSRIVNEIDEFAENVNRLQSKLSNLFNALQQAENESAADRCRCISEKLETLKNSFEDFKTRAAKAKAQREAKSTELNKMIAPELNSLAINSMSMKDLRGIRPPNFSTFVSDNDFHLAESISEEWGKLRRKLDNYFHRYLEDTTSLKVEVFGATYSTNSNADDSPKSLVRRLSNLISSKKNSHNHSHGSHNSGSTTIISVTSSKSNSRPHYARSESFFYCPTPNTSVPSCSSSPNAEPCSSSSSSDITDITKQPHGDYETGEMDEKEGNEEGQQEKS